MEPLEDTLQQCIIRNLIEDFTIVEDADFLFGFHHRFTITLKPKTPQKISQKLMDYIWENYKHLSPKEIYFHEPSNTILFRSEHRV